MSEKVKTESQTEVKVVSKKEQRIDGRIISGIKRHKVAIITGVASFIAGLAGGVYIANCMGSDEMSEEFEVIRNALTDDSEVLATFTHADGTTVDVDLT